MLSQNQGSAFGLDKLNDGVLIVGGGPCGLAAVLKFTCAVSKFRLDSIFNVHSREVVISISKLETDVNSNLNRGLHKH